MHPFTVHLFSSIEFSAFFFWFQFSFVWMDFFSVVSFWSTYSSCQNLWNGFIFDSFFVSFSFFAISIVFLIGSSAQSIVQEKMGFSVVGRDAELLNHFLVYALDVVIHPMKILPIMRHFIKTLGKFRSIFLCFFFSVCST